MQAVLLDGKGEKGTKGGREPTDHDSVAGPLSFDGGLSYDEHHYDEDSAARVRYSFTAEQDAELTVSAGEDLTILEVRISGLSLFNSVLLIVLPLQSNDANWFAGCSYRVVHVLTSFSDRWLVSNSKGVRGLIPAVRLALPCHAGLD